LTEDLLASQERLCSREFVTLHTRFCGTSELLHHKDMLRGLRNVTTVQQIGHVEASGPLQTKGFPEVDVTSTLTYAPTLSLYFSH